MVYLSTVYESSKFNEQPIHNQHNVTSKSQMCPTVILSQLFFFSGDSLLRWLECLLCERWGERSFAELLSFDLLRSLQYKKAKYKVHVLYRNKQNQVDLSSKTRFHTSLTLKPTIFNIEKHVKHINFESKLCVLCNITESGLIAYQRI